MTSCKGCIIREQLIGQLEFFKSSVMEDDKPMVEHYLREIKETIKQYLVVESCKGSRGASQ